MTWRKGRLLAALLMLCVFVGLYLAVAHEWIGPRRALLGTQLTTDITWLGPKLVLAAVILLLTALFGRWYCSLLCPAGLVQEAFSRLGRALKLSRLGYTDSPRPANMLIIFAILTLTGFIWIVNIVDPLGLFGRAMLPLSDIWRKHVTGVGEADALGAAAMGVLIISVVLLAVIPLFFGRLFCDRVCPAGMLLKLAGAGAGRRVRLVKKECAACGECERVCPARCIDAKTKTIDAKRCLLCLDCLDACPSGAIAYAPWRPEGRRKFMDTAAVGVCAGIYAFSRELRGTFPTRPEPPTGIMPPGVVDAARYRQRCVTCQACVLSCPVRIIRPGGDSRPVLDYDRGYCQYNCQMCAGACPAGVFARQSLAEKHATRIAKTVLHEDRCIVVTQGTACGACAEVCPTHAVFMREQGEGLPTLPDFAPEHCIGCGACYHVCPSEPRSFTLTALERHETSRGVRPLSHFPSPAEPAEKRPHSPEDLHEFPF